MQGHRKLEETAFWAGLARSLCELQLTSRPRSLAPNWAENIPNATEDNAPHVFASGLCSRTLCTWRKSDKHRSLSLFANSELLRGVFIQYLSKVTKTLLQSQLHSQSLLQHLSVGSGLQNKSKHYNIGTEEIYCPHTFALLNLPSQWVYWFLLLPWH